MSKSKKQKCCTIVSKIIFGHLGVCILVILYCIFGGFLFEYLEKKNEIYICYDKRNDYRNLENKTFHELYDILNAHENITVKYYEIEEMMQSYRDGVVSIGYTGEDCSAFGKPGGPKHEWTFSGSLFFSVTVISTIGYGHISPKTEWGRLTCITYAVLGIPLVMICLALIGDTFADVIKFVYYKICCCGFCRSGYPPFVKVKGGSTPEPTTTEKTLIMTKAVEFWKKNKVAHSPNPSPEPNTISDRIQKIKSNVDDNSEKDYDDDIGDENGDDILLSNISVPLTVTLIIVAVYILAGAFLFGFWENWELLQSSYFCFITLSTIGFGDIVPGTDFEDPTAQLRMLIGAAYMLFGLTILSMAFSLMQEELTAKFKWIGRKLGIVDESCDE
ncbi:hypothetical protein KUTeg_018043 [Tegillarca granosa]|uniref:Potassium channel domain-containing protein n=1 Tax=Tegillarca granosa TaxID=220873 RepID=A0ABQ9EGX8_TEGGR|nr:hypothetical protein KUTeg_018043 [Tegillarca granosa]